MIPLRPTLLCAAGIMAGFAAGWFLKPAPVLESAVQATDSLLREWLAKDKASLGEWLNRNRASPSFDLMASQLAKHLSEEDPEAARSWAAKIADPIKRETLEKELSKDQEPMPEDAAVIQ